MASRDYFKGKRIAVIGIGPHGEMVEDIKYLIKAGALVALYDMRSEARIKAHLTAVRAVGLANYVCGSIPPDDLLDMDLIILSHEYPRDSSFLAEVYKNKIPVEYPETLFFKQAPPVTLVSIMGSCGKATILSMLAPMLEAACLDGQSRQSGQGNQNFFTINPESSEGIIAHLKTVKNGDMVLMRVIEPMMKELHAMRISPYVAVFTTVPEKNAFVKSPFEILEFQTYNNYIVASDEVIDAIRNLKYPARAKMLRTKATVIPTAWQFNGKGAHDRDNAALAVETARIFKVNEEVIQRDIEGWKSLKGRLELVKKIKNVDFYNDTASVMSCSTELAVRSLSENKNLVLVMGGADNGCDHQALYKLLPMFVHTLILLPGSGTMKERAELRKLDHVRQISAPSVEEAARLALENAHKGDKVLFSPGFEAGGFDRSREERGDRFVKAVRAL